MRKEDEYVANIRATLASYDFHLKFYLLQLFQDAKKKSISLVIRNILQHGAYIQRPTTPLSFIPL